MELADGFIHEGETYCQKCLGDVDPGLAHPTEDGQSDQPINCRTCGVLLKHHLTNDGISYVIQAMADLLTDGPVKWNVIHVFPSVPPQFRTGNVLGLIEAIVSEDALDRLPVLADALEEAGASEENPPGLLAWMRNGTPGGVASHDNLLAAILGSGRDEFAHYRYARQAEIVRDWAKVLYENFGADDGFVRRFLEITAPEADTAKLLDEYVAKETEGELFDNEVTWLDIQAGWEFWNTNPT